ncbi:nucleotide exchange factor GrpE [Streptomyces tricolor]|nr:nucleotide exchange factor GrpE [Streptomyces tricolor]
MKAEYDNYRTRVRRDRMAVREIAVANVLTALLPVVDAVDRTCAHEPLTPGLKDIRDTLWTQLGSLRLRGFGEEGEPFDPACHEGGRAPCGPGRAAAGLRGDPQPRIPGRRPAAAAGLRGGHRAAVTDRGAAADPGGGSASHRVTGRPVSRPPGDRPRVHLVDAP